MENEGAGLWGGFNIVAVAVERADGHNCDVLSRENGGNRNDEKSRKRRTEEADDAEGAGEANDDEIVAAASLMHKHKA